ncbi:SEC-C metal-binding domain-containing protein [Pseudomonas batumici]|uniref:SEC-C metal-binding domain-containing protein n=1 Tax=Pseudomonas batumici TaxID=226910 RepID=UPI0030D441AF
MLVASIKSTGRNETCPCGSGVKYKKCCALIFGVEVFMRTRAENFTQGNLARKDFFSKRYSVISHYFIRSPRDEPVHLGSHSKRECRYCGRTEVETSFKNESHALPMFIGNKVIFDCNECDECNSHFGKYLEDSFSKYAQPHLVFSRIRGRGIPKYKSNDLKVSADAERNLSIYLDPDGFDLHVDKERKLLTYSLVRQSYYPIDVYKMFVKIALAVMPERKLENLENLKKWLLRKDREYYFTGDLPVVEWKIPGPRDPDKLWCTLYEVVPEYAGECYRHILVLGFGCFQYQVIIPTDAVPGNRGFAVAPVMVSDEFVSKYGAPGYSQIDFISNEIKRGEKVEISLTYEAVEEYFP